MTDVAPPQHRARPVRISLALLTVAAVLAGLAAVSGTAGAAGTVSPTQATSGSTVTLLPTTTTTSPTTTTTVAHPSTTAAPTTPPPANPPPVTTTTTIAPPGGPIPSNPAPPSTIPVPASTVPPEQLGAVVQGLQVSFTQLDAMAAYLQDVEILTNAQAGAASLDAGMARAQAQQRAAAAEREAAAANINANVRHLSGLAMALYLHEDVGSNTSREDLAGTLGSRRVMLDLLIDHGKRQVSDARQTLSTANQTAKTAAEQVKQAEAVVARAHETVAQAAANLANDKAAALGHPAKGPKGTPIPTIMGPSALTAAEMAGWFATSGHQANTTVPIAELAQDYVTAGQAEGVRADIAFAQSIIETGYFGFPAGGQLVAADNNFAGIGACDSCAHGWAFPDARTGVAAQLQLLHAYASKTPISTPLIGPVGVHGCCDTWMALTGVWATSSHYGFAVLAVYKSMVEWALPRRQAGTGLTAP